MEWFGLSDGKVIIDASWCFEKPLFIHRLFIGQGPVFSFQDPGCLKLLRDR
jgi:hypothetical protein